MAKNLFKCKPTLHQVHGVLATLHQICGVLTIACMWVYTIQVLLTTMYELNFLIKVLESLTDQVCIGMKQ